jgi:DNA-binding MarR family transcriptional regulator
MTMADEDELAPWRWMLLAHAAALRAIEAELARQQAIPLAWYDVLLELNAAEGRRLRMSELGERAVLSRTRVSRIVDDLVAAGLVERRANPDDRRSSFAQLTEKGRAELRRAAPHYLAGIEKHFLALLDPGERTVLATALQRVADHHRDAHPDSRRG